MYYGLDPCHYFSSPGLCWDAMLKMTDVKLEKNIRHWQVFIYLLKKEQDEEFLRLLKDMLKQIINTWVIMTLKHHEHS